MRITVNPANLAQVLAEHQPIGGSGRAAVGLAAIGVALLDILSIAHEGHGPTGLVVSWLVSMNMSPVTAASWTAVLLDTALLWGGMSALRGSSWLALFRRRLSEMVTRLPTFADAPPTLATFATWAAPLVCAVYVTASLTDGVAAFVGSTAGGVLLALLPGVMAGALVLGIAGTVRLKRPLVGGAAGLVALLNFVILLGSPSLAQTFGAGHEAGVVRLTNWAILAFGTLVAVLLFMSVETDEEALTLLFEWDPSTSGPHATTFEHRPMTTMSYRRVILHVQAQGRPILLVTKKVGEPSYVVSKPPPLDESRPIDLNQTGFTIWDLPDVSASLFASADRATSNTVVDLLGLLKVEVTPYARPSTAKLPDDFRIGDSTFRYLRDHVFLPGALAQQMSSAVTTAVRDLSARAMGSGAAGLDGDGLARMVSSWEDDFLRLDLVHSADNLHQTNVLFRTPAHLNGLRHKEVLAEEIVERIGRDSAQLLMLENRLKAVAADLPQRVEECFFRSVEALLRDMDNEQQQAVRAVLGLFNVTCGAQTGSLDGLAALRKDARSVREKIVAAKKEAESKVEASQRDVDETLKALMANPALSPPQRKFVEAWIRHLSPPAPPPSPPPLPPAPPSAGGLPPPNRKRF